MWRPVAALTVLLSFSAAASAADDPAVRRLLRSTLDKAQAATLDPGAPLEPLIQAMRPEQKSAARKKLLALEKTNPPAPILQDIAQAYIFLGEYDGALRSAAAIRKTDPKDPNGPSLAAVALNRKGDLAEAVEAAREALRLDPGNPNALAVLRLYEGRAKAAPQRPSEAAFPRQMARSATPGATAGATRPLPLADNSTEKMTARQRGLEVRKNLEEGVRLLQLGDPEGALGHAERVLELDPANEMARRMADDLAPIAAERRARGGAPGEPPSGRRPASPLPIAAFGGLLGILAGSRIHRRESPTRWLVLTGYGLVGAVGAPTAAALVSQWDAGAKVMTDAGMFGSRMGPLGGPEACPAGTVSVPLPVPPPGGAPGHGPGADERRVKDRRCLEAETAFRACVQPSVGRAARLDCLREADSAHDYDRDYCPHRYEPKDGAGHGSAPQAAPGSSVGPAAVACLPEKRAGEGGGGAPTTYKATATEEKEASESETAEAPTEETVPPAIQKRRRQNELLKASTRYRAEINNGNFSRQQIEWMNARQCPLGFQNPEQFQQFRKELKTALVESGLPDATARMKGTATTFYSENPGKPIGHHFDADPGNLSDMDINIASDIMVNRFKKSGIGVNPKYGIFSTKFVSQYFEPLKNFARNWENILGRRVAFVGLPNAKVYDRTDWFLTSVSNETK